MVGRDEPAEIFRVHPAIAVGDDLQREVVHPGQPGRGTVAQARQFPAVTLGQVPLGGANLFFDQIEVIEQPLPGRRDLAGRRDRNHEQRADVDQGPFVLGQPRQKLVRPMSRRQLMRGRETPAVLFHLDGAEQFRAQRRLVADVFFGRAIATEAHPPLEQGFAKGQGHRATSRFAVSDFGANSFVNVVHFARAKKLTKLPVKRLFDSVQTKSIVILPVPLRAVPDRTAAVIRDSGVRLVGDDHRHDHLCRYVR